MARDDDDDDDRPRKRRRRDEDDDDAFEDSARPRTRSRRDDDEDDDDDRPRKKRRYDDEDAEDDRSLTKIKKKGLPGMLLAAGIVAIAWGGICILSSCGTSGKSFMDWHNLRQVDRIFGGLIRDFGGPTPGLFMTLGIVYGFMMLASVLLCVGGILLLMRKNIGKYLSIGGPVLMGVVGVIGFIAGVVVTRGGLFSAAALMGLPAVVFFTLCVGGFLIFALMQKDVVKALK